MILFPLDFKIENDYHFHIMGYNTEQKNLIIKCFETNKDSQLGASDVLGFLAQNNTKIGIATIYRNLESLEKEGKIKKFIDVGGRQACWQYNSGHCGQHYHLKCFDCGKVIHLECGLVENLENHIGKEHGFAMDREKTIFYGRCNLCASKETEN